jgi:hypothetical protein
MEACFPQRLPAFTGGQTIFLFQNQQKRRKLGTLGLKSFGISLFNIPLIAKAESGSESILKATK